MRPSAGVDAEERFLKLGARVVVSMRRVVVHLPQSFPVLAAFRQIAMGWEHRRDRTTAIHTKQSTFRMKANDNTAKPCLKSAAEQWLPICKDRRLGPLNQNHAESNRLGDAISPETPSDLSSRIMRVRRADGNA